MMIGHERQIMYLDRVLKRGRLAHAYLFYGPEGVGKRTFALALAAALTCTDRPRTVLGACGVCRPCKAAETGTHPAVTMIAPGRGEGTGRSASVRDIAIDEVRALKRRLRYVPAPGEWRTVVIDRAERMTLQAANALLKTLEEPGARTVFMLVTDQPALLPRTVVSRAQPIRFSLVPERDMARLLHNLQGRNSADLLRFAGGRPGRLVRLAADRALGEREARIETGIAECRTGSLAAALRLAEWCAKDPALAARLLERVIGSVREGLLKHTKCGSIFLSTFQRIRRLHRIAAASAHTNVQPRLALEAALVTLKHACHELCISCNNRGDRRSRTLRGGAAVSFRDAPGELG